MKNLKSLIEMPERIMSGVFLTTLVGPPPFIYYIQCYKIVLMFYNYHI
jgi:hypothetical protein